ncbi:MAG: hypothetical protein ACRDDZ_00455 [Marinifilaceae bacterium]
MKKIIIQVLLLGVIGVLGFLCYNSIMIPQRFTEIKKQRYDATIARLKDIRSAQEAYKDAFGGYTSSFDSLINFVKYDSVKVVRSIGSLTDDQIDQGMTEEMAIRQGLILRDTIRVAALTTIFTEDYNVDALRYVPFTKQQHQFKMASTTQISDQGVVVPLFEARVSNMVIFENIRDEYDEQLKEENGERLRLNKYPGLKVGDIREANNNVGNWE